MAVKGRTSGDAGERVRLKRPATGVTASDVAPEQTPSAVASEHNGSGAVGRRLRARRESLGISLRQFARDLNVSASFISQLETGKAQPSVATLYAICTALVMSIDDVFDVEPETVHEVESTEEVGGAMSQSASLFARSAETQGTDEGAPKGRSRAERGRRSPVVSPSQRRRIVLDSGVTWERLSSTSKADFDFVFVRYDVGGSSNSEGLLIRHEGTECGYVLRGLLEVTLGFETFLMRAGDAISYDSSTPHRLANVGNEPVEAIWFDEGGHNDQP